MGRGLLQRPILPEYAYLCDMIQYIVRRVLSALPVLLGILFVTFALARLIPGDPCRAALGERATDQVCDAFIKRNGLDRPIPVQFFYYLKDVFSGDLGEFRLDLLVQQAGGDQTLGMVYLLEKILTEQQVASGRVGLYGILDAGRAYASFTRLQQALPELELQAFIPIQHIQSLYLTLFVAVLVLSLVDRMWKKLPSDHPAVYREPAPAG